MPRPILKRDGHNWGKPALNQAGLAYTIIVVIYTGLLLYGIGLLWMKRRHAAVRIRGFFITAAAVLALHVYVAALFIVYPLNGWFKCGTEFWYMSTLLPLGIAIFQASNVRFLFYAKIQQDLIHQPLWGQQKVKFSLQPAEFKAWFKHLNYMNKTYICIGLGLVIQLITTFILFFGSKRFMPSTGFFGESVNPTECRRGVEWIPSVFWQFIWAWIIGPYISLKTRHVKDTHFWGLQTRLAIIAGLPGTPLWLTFLYSSDPTIEKISAWFPPAMWFAPGLITMQVSSIFIPLYDAYRQRESKRPLSSTSTSSSAPSKRSSDSLDIRQSKHLMNLAALDFQLAHNIDPLLEFAGSREFSAENILFLREVRKFKTQWRRRTACSPTGSMGIGQAEHLEMYTEAAKIFFELIDPGTSKQPVNIDSKVFSNLSQIFHGLHYAPPPYAEVFPESSKRTLRSALNEVAPWASPNSSTEELPRQTMPYTNDCDVFTDNPDVISPADITRTPNALLLIPPATYQSPSRTTTGKDSLDFVPPVTRNGSPLDLTKPVITSNLSPTELFYRCPPQVPASFSSAVFDEAEKSVKYLVYTNTWTKFVVLADTESIISSSSRDFGADDLPGAGVGVAEMQDSADLTRTYCKACQKAAKKAAPKPSKSGLKSLV